MFIRPAGIVWSVHAWKWAWSAFRRLSEIVKLFYLKFNNIYLVNILNIEFKNLNFTHQKTLGPLVASIVHNGRLLPLVTRIGSNGAIIDRAFESRLGIEPVALLRRRSRRWLVENDALCVCIVSHRWDLVKLIADFVEWNSLYFKVN